MTDEELLDTLCKDRLTRRGYEVRKLPAGSPPTMFSIMCAVAHRYGYGLDDLVGPCREAPVARARAVAMFLARNATKMTLLQIGKAFNRGHDTAHCAIKSIAREVELNPDFQKELLDLSNGLP